jgi:hypothetical protein
MKLIIFLLEFAFNSFVQISNWKIEYGLQIPTFEGLEKATRMKDTYSKATVNTQFLNFDLIFDTNYSFFLLSMA